MLREMLRHRIRIDGTIEDLGPNPIFGEVVFGCSSPEALELWSYWEYLALANRVLYRICNPSNRDRNMAGCSTGDYAIRSVVPTIVVPGTRFSP